MATDGRYGRAAVDQVVDTNHDAAADTEDFAPHGNDETEPMDVVSSAHAPED